MNRVYSVTVTTPHADQPARHFYISEYALLFPALHVKKGNAFFISFENTEEGIFRTVATKFMFKI